VERVPLGRLADPRFQIVVQPAEPVDQLVGLRSRKRLEQDGGGVHLAAAPAWPEVEQLRAGDAEEQNGGAPAEVGHVLDQVEEGRLTPVDVVEDTNERRLGRCLLERVAKGPGDLVRRRRLLRVTEKGRERAGGRLVRRPRSELKERLGYGPVGDSLAVGEAEIGRASCRERGKSGGGAV